MSVGTAKKPLPIKMELLRLKRSLSVAKNVHKILEDKREVLLKKVDELIEKAEKAREELMPQLSKAYEALYEAYMKMGPSALDSVAATTPPQLKVRAKTIRVMDVRVPTVEFEEKGDGLTYGFAGTSPALDEATQLLRRLLPGMVKIAEVENSILSLARELERVQRLLNALEYVVIPQYEENIRFISMTLEERAREDFVRMKRIKEVLERRRGV